LHVFLTSVGFEAALVEEIGGPRPARWPGAVGFAEDLPGRDPVFGRQSLPAAIQVKGDSVRELAEGAYSAIAGPLDAPAPLVLQTFVPDPEAYARLAGRAALVGEGLRELVRQRKRRAWKRLTEASSPQALVVQGALVGRTSLLVSAAHPTALPGGGWDIAPWPAGIAPITEDRAAPSRAYGKLEESFAWLAAAPAPGERCVDLGGAPGGWSWRALERGAAVLAVDRAPLLPPAAGHPRLTMVRGDAFRFRPEAPVDWLLCDVVADPERTVEVVERWMAEGWCRRLVATLKFKGRGGYAVLGEARQRLGAVGWRHLRFKHLFRHHNEVSIMASRDLQKEQAPSP
jgi:23S rRNA (cytidine2498-2'-O)-methyltransferase